MFFFIRDRSYYKVQGNIEIVPPFSYQIMIYRLKQVTWGFYTLIVFFQRTTGNFVVTTPMDKFSDSDSVLWSNGDIGHELRNHIDPVAL